jgi:muconolactone delta-isomerase
MLFLVVSHPRPERPSTVASTRQAYWTWLAPLQAGGEVRHAYPRVGRGVAAVFDVASNERLHTLLTEWSEMIPAEFDVFPLVDAEVARQALRVQEGGPLST